MNRSIFLHIAASIELDKKTIIQELRPKLAAVPGIVLLGIVKKNAIMMIDFVLEAERKDGMAPTEAIYEGRWSVLNRS